MSALAAIEWAARTKAKFIAYYGAGNYLNILRYFNACENTTWKKYVHLFQVKTAAISLISC